MRLQIISIIVSFFIALAVGYFVIPLLKRLKAGQQIRKDGPQSHLSKEGTPTMGGLIILLSTIVTTLIFAKGDLNMILVAIAAFLGFSLIGLVDDMIIVLKKRSLGLRAWQKMLAQIILGTFVAVYAYNNVDIGSKLLIPILNIEWDLGVWFIPFTVFVIVGMANSVNLTDGLDGLASSVSLLNSLTFCFVFSGLILLSQQQGRFGLSSDMSNMMVFCAALAGGCLGFLRFNAYPAKVFMGDTGSLGLGAAIAVMAIFSKLQLLLPIVSFMFMMSTISVILQVGSYKLRNGKRIFKMAPLHHHFELKGVKETKIVVSYMIVTAILCMLTLLALTF
jgi:phospho-N-acetylmuramoyl-pentapeptide-transferase